MFGDVDKSKPSVIQSDASKNGLGTFFLQDGKTIVYALKSLTVQRFSNIEKDGLQPTEKRSVQRMAYCLKATGSLSLRNCVHQCNREVKNQFSI